MRYSSSSSNQNQNEALRYASLGYKVYPVWGIQDGKCLCGGMEGCRPGKHPYGRFVPHGEKDATSDADTIRRWFKGGGVNVGISISGFCVLDPDCHSNEANGLKTLAEWERQYVALPITPTVQSGGGGRHYYFQPLSMPLKQKVQVGVGIELLTSGCVIAPPSLHEKGKRYEWLVPLETPPAVMPSWLVEIVAKSSLPLRGSEAAPLVAFNPMKGVVSAGQTFSKLGLLPAHARNPDVNSVVGSMLGNGFTPEQVLAEGLRWAEQQEPPYSADDLREKVRFFSAKQEVKITDLAYPQNEPLHKDETVKPLVVRCSPFADAGETDNPPTPVEPSSDAYYGVLGDFVKAVAPHTEADAMGILACLLCGVGNALGRNTYHRIGTRHAANLFILLMGETSNARKGTCWDVAEELLGLVEPEWADGCLENGFGSGQGLIGRIGDANGDKVGVPDKRLMVIEQEFSKPLKLAKSENSILSSIVRGAFDGKPLGIMNLEDNRHSCREPHISTIGMITPDELLKLVKGMTAVQDGFLNRFLMCGVKRTRMLSRGSDWYGVAVRFAPYLREAMAKAKACREPFTIDESIWDLWDVEYARLEQHRHGDYGKVTARLSVHCLKVAMVYASLDGSQQIREPHLRAALSLIAHADRTALEVFGGSAMATASDEPPEVEPPHAKLLNLIRSRPDGIIKRDAHRLFNNKRKAADLDADFRLLEQHGFIVEFEGRWYAKECFKGGVEANETQAVCVSASSEQKAVERGSL